MVCIFSLLVIFILSNQSSYIHIVDGPLKTSNTITTDEEKNGSAERKAAAAVAAAEAKKSGNERVLLIDEDSLPPSKPNRSALKQLTQLIQGLFSNNQDQRATPDNAKDDKDRAKQSMHNLQMKIKQEVIPEVERNFVHYHDIRRECKRLGLGGNGKR